MVQQEGVRTLAVGMVVHNGMHGGHHRPFKGKNLLLQRQGEVDASGL